MKLELLRKLERDRADHDHPERRVEDLHEQAGPLEGATAVVLNCLAHPFEQRAAKGEVAARRLAVDRNGNMMGSVSGGCIEGAVVHESGSVMADGAPRLLEYGVTDEMAWEVGLACGGTVKVFVERIE